MSHHKVDSPVTPKDRQDALLEEMRKYPLGLTVTEAWEVGNRLGFYVGGDGMVAKGDLNALCQRNQARRTDGFWRHIGEPDSIRTLYPRWADYWTAR